MEPQKRNPRGKAKRTLDQQQSEDPKQKKTWSKQEVDLMAEFVVKFNGKITPRANFIRHMITTNGWTHLSFTQVGNKWDMLHRSYVDAVRWKNETGQGVLEEEGEISFEEALLRRCPQFEIMNSVLSTKPSVNAPAVIELGAPSTNIAVDNMEILPPLRNEAEINPEPLQHLSPDPETIISASNRFRDSLERGTPSSKPTGKSGQDRLMEAFERKSSIDQQKLELHREELKLKRSEADSRNLVENDKMKLARYELERKANMEQQELKHRHTMELVKLTNDPLLLQELVQQCLAMPMTAPPPPPLPQDFEAFRFAEEDI